MTRNCGDLRKAQLNGDDGMSKIFQTTRLGTTAAFLLYALSGLTPVYSQESEVRACYSTASDPDNDGFGWEWNKDIGALDTCVITEQSTAAPTYTNRATGEEVQLIRPYWNASRDLAERDIKCTAYSWNSLSGDNAYEENRTYTSNLYHHALPHSAPYTAYAEYDERPYFVSADLPLDPVWTVIDGKYFGPMMASYNGWVEIIEETGTRPAGIRIWRSGSFDYSECFDLSGAPLQPTGYTGEELPAEEPENRTLIVTTEPAPDYPEPLIDPDTGEEVELKLAHWDVYEHFWGRVITCHDVEKDESGWHQTSFPSRFKFFPVSTGSQSGLAGYRHPSASGYFEWEVVDGVIDFNWWELGIFDKVQIVPDGTIRSWRSSEWYWECYDTGSMVGIYENTLDPRPLIPLDPETVQAALEITDNSATDSSDSTEDATNNQIVANDDSSTTAVTVQSTGQGGGGSIGLHWLLLVLLMFLSRYTGDKVIVRARRRLLSCICDLCKTL